jgi:hypothetical protein
MQDVVRQSLLLLCCCLHLQVVATLGPSAVALASHTQQLTQRLLVDEYSFSYSTGSYTLAAASVELATYLHSKGLNIALVPDVKAAAAAATAFWAAVASGKEDEEALECVALPNSVAVALGLRSAQSSSNVLMVAPTAFGFNEDAAQDNSFMHAAEKPRKGSQVTEEVSAPGCWCIKPAAVESRSRSASDIDNFKIWGWEAA